MPQIFDVIANENAPYKRNELEALAKSSLMMSLIKQDVFEKHLRPQASTDSKTTLTFWVIDYLYHCTKFDAFRMYNPPPPTKLWG